MRPIPPEMPDDPIADMDAGGMCIDMLTKMTRAELDMVPYTEYLWTCAAEGCTRCTTVRDYGHYFITGHIYWRRRFMVITSYYYLCSRHSKIERKFLRSFDRTTYEVADVVKGQPFALKPRSEHHKLIIKPPKV